MLPRPQAYPLTDPITASTLHPILLGAALTTVLFLTFIGFARRRATVIETALVFLYVVYSAWMSARESRMRCVPVLSFGTAQARWTDTASEHRHRPHAFEHGWLTDGWGRSKPLPFAARELDLDLGLQRGAINGPHPLLGIARYLAVVFGAMVGIDVERWLGGGTSFVVSGGGGAVTRLAMTLAGHTTESIRKM